MPSYPLDDGTPVDVGDLPVVTAEDVRALLPPEYLQKDDAPVRDALIAAQAAMHVTWHDRIAYAVQQSDFLRATEQYLLEQARDRGFAPGANESEEDFRSRVIADPKLVTRVGIAEAINAILTRIDGEPTCEVSESILDRWYVRSTSDTEGWRSFVGRNPNYPDRLYADAGLPPEQTRKFAEPGGARVFFNAVGRMLVIRVPDLGVLDGLRGFVASVGREDGFFVRAAGSGSEEQGAFLAKDATTGLAIYTSIANTVNSIKGHSVRWVIFIDARLN